MAVIVWFFEKDGWELCCEVCAGINSLFTKFTCCDGLTTEFSITALILWILMHQFHDSDTTKS